MWKAMSDEDKQQYVDRATVSSMQVLITHYYIVVITLSVVSVSSSSSLLSSLLLSLQGHRFVHAATHVPSNHSRAAPPAAYSLVWARAQCFGATGARLCSTPSPSLKLRRRMGRCRPTIGSRFPVTTVGSVGPLRRQAPSALSVGRLRRQSPIRLRAVVCPQAWPRRSATRASATIRTRPATARHSGTPFSMNPTYLVSGLSPTYVVSSKNPAT
jgi:hypothetical protein